MKCTDCNGTGTIALFTSRKPCGACGGTGEAAQPRVCADFGPGVWNVARPATITATNCKTYVILDENDGEYRMLTPAERAEQDRLRKMFNDALGKP